MDDPDAMYPGFTETGLTSAEIQSLLDEYECPRRTVKGIHDTIEAGQAVVDYFYFGPKGPDGLMPEVFERYVYIENMFRKILGGGSRTARRAERRTTCTWGRKSICTG